MCLMCIEIAKGKMTISEARRALPELVSTNDAQNKAHYLELQKSNDQELVEKAKEYQSKHTKG